MFESYRLHVLNEDAIGFISLLLAYMVVIRHLQINVAEPWEPAGTKIQIRFWMCHFLLLKFLLDCIFLLWILCFTLSIRFGLKNRAFLCICAQTDRFEKPFHHSISPK